MTSEPVDPLFGFALEPPVGVKARDLELVRITAERFRELNHRWHSRLPDIDRRVMKWGDVTLCYAAVFDEWVYAVALWTRPVAGNRLSRPVGCYLELRRMATSEDRPANTATRFLRLMRNDIATRLPDVCMLLSYQDTEVHVGTIYKADNWQPSTSTPNSHQTWDSHSDPRRRAPDQSTAPKMRWEYALRQCEVQVMMV